jgi:tape measure domain-containing protein
MGTFAELNIKVNSDGVKQSTSDLKALETQASQTERSVASYANSTIILSRKQIAAYEAEKAAQAQLLTQKLAQLAEMKRVEDRVISEHKARQDTILAKTRERIAQEQAAEKANADKIAQLRKQAYLGASADSTQAVKEAPGAAAARQAQYDKEKKERIQAEQDKANAIKAIQEAIAQSNLQIVTQNAQKIRSIDEAATAAKKAELEKRKVFLQAMEQSALEIVMRNAQKQREAEEAVTAAYKAEIAKRRVIYASLPATMGTSQQTSPTSQAMIQGMSQSGQQAAQAQNAILAQRTALYNNMTAAMSQNTNVGIQNSQVTANMITRMDQYNRQLREATIAQQQQSQAVQRTITSHSMFDRVLTKSLAILTAMAAYRTLSFLINIPGDIMNINVEMELLRVRLEGLTGSVEKAKVAFKDLISLDFKTPFDIEALTKAFLTLKNYGINPTERVMTALTDNVSKFGGTSENMIGVATQLGQAWSKGKLQLQDMRVIIENGLPIISLLAKTLDTSNAEILRMSKEGTITTEVMSKLFDTMERESAGSSARQMNTLNGALSNAKTAWIQLSDAIMEDKSESFIKTMFNGMTEAMKMFTSAITDVIDYNKKLKENFEEIAQTDLKIKFAKENPLITTLDSVTGGQNLQDLIDQKTQLLKQQDLIIVKLREEAKVREQNNKESQTEVASDRAALAQEEALMNKIMTAEDQAAKKQIEIHNSKLDAQINGIKNVEEVTKAQFAMELEGYEKSAKDGELNYQELYLAKVDFIHKELALKIKTLDEMNTLEKQKLSENVANHKTAYEAIREVESHGQSGQVNKDSHALGMGQVLPSTLINPGYGVKPFEDAVKKGITFFKGNVTELQAWVKSHEVGLDKFAETYFNALVKHFGSVESAIQHYGEHTPEYMAKVVKAWKDQTGATEDQIKIAMKSADIDKEISLAKIEAKQAEQKATEEYEAKRQEGDDAAIKALAELKDKYNQLTMSASAYYAQKLKEQGVPQEQIPGLVDFKKQVDSAEEVHKKYEENIKALETYSNSVGQVQTQMNDLGGVTDAVFQGALGGVNVMVGALQNMVKHLEQNRIKMEELAKTKKIIDETNPVKGTDNYEKDIKLKHDMEIKYEKDKQDLQNDTINQYIQGTSLMASAATTFFEDSKQAQIANQAVALVTLGIQAVQAIVTQGQGDPYTAFARIAAMAAIIGAMVRGVGGKSPGGAGSAGWAKESPTTGTVLGDKTKASQSVSNIVKVLEDIHAEEYAELRGINEGVHSLATGITNVVTKVFQNGGLTQQVLPKDKTSYKSPLIGIFLPVKTSYSTAAQGIQTDPFKIGDMVKGMQYDVIQITKKSLFSTKTRFETYYTELQDNVTKGLTDVFDSIGQVMLATGDTLGKQIGMDFSQKIKDYVIPALNIDLKGLNAEDASKKVNEVISTALDTMAVSVFGDILGQYQQLGEGMLETAIRIVSEIAVVRDALEASGLKLKPQNVIAFSDAIVQAMGGLNAFKKAWQTFFDAFYTDAEKQARLKDQLFSTVKGDTGQLTDVFTIKTPKLTRAQKKAGETVQSLYPDFDPYATLKTLAASREGYRKVLEGININTVAGQKQYTTLIQLSSAMDDYYKGLEADQAKVDDLSKQRHELELQLMEAQGKGAEALAIRRQEELDAMDASLKPLQEAIYAAQDALDLQTKTAELQKQQRAAEIELMQAQGNAAGALAAQRSDELAAMDASLRPIKEMVYAAQDAAVAQQKANEIAKQRTSLEIDLLTAQGDSVGALARKRQEELLALDDSLKSIQLQIYAAEDLTAANNALRDSMSKTVQGNVDSLNTQLSDLSKTFGDWEPKIQTVSDKLNENKSALDNLKNGLNDILGVSQTADLDKLKNLVSLKTSITDFRKGLSSAIADALVSGKSAAIRAGALQARESALFGQLATSTDPMAVAQELQSVISSRVQAQAEAATAAIEEENKQIQAAYDAQHKLRQDQIDAINAQIDGMQKIKDIADQVNQFLGQLKFSDLSPQTYTQQLGSAKDAWMKTLIGAKAGNESDLSNLTGNAQAYLQEARTYYASNEQYTAIFNQVTKALEEFGVKGQGVDLKLEAAKEQIKQLEALNAVEVKLKDTAVDLSAQQVAALQALDAAMAARQITTDTQIATQTSAIQQQINSLQSIIDGQQAQMDQAQVIGLALQAQLEAQTAALNQLNDSNVNPTSVVIPPMDGSHADGLSFVPFDGYRAILHKGERVQTAQSVKDDGVISQEIILELKALRDEVTRLRSEQNEQTGAIIQSNYDANNRAADKTVKGSVEASKNVAWAVKTAPIVK